MEMALGINTESGGGGDFMPIVKYDARAGRVFRVDRELDAGGEWETKPIDITSNFSAVFDLENIETGWLLFAAGTAPDIRTVRIGEPVPARPTDQHKNGFRLTLRLSKECGGDVREFSSAAKSVIGAMDDLHNSYLAGKVANPGMLPLVKMTGTEPISTKSPKGTTTNYAPVFEIVRWVKRPEDLASKPKAPAAPAAPASTGSTRVPPPQMAAAAAADEEWA
jgi:hypothetical protein